VVSQIDNQQGETKGSLSADQVKRLTAKAWARFTKTRQYITKYRRPHFFNESSADPVLKEPMQDTVFQSDIARRKWEQLKARLTENHAIVHVSPQEQTISEKSAEDMESVLNAILMMAEERNGYIIQDALADGQIVDGCSILHWRRFSQGWPKVPDNEYLDEAPEADDELDDEFTKARKKRTRSRFEEDTDDDGNRTGKWRETDASVLDRTKHDRARAGSPYEIEVLDPTSFAWIEDRIEHVGIGVYIREVGITDFNDAQAGDNLKLVLSEGRELHIYEGEAPGKDMPSGSHWDTITVATVWTKNEWYELASPDAITVSETGELLKNDSWKLVKAGTHAFGRAPFEVVAAARFNMADPAMRYLPMCEGIYRIKPHYDKAMALLMAAAERHAIPDVFIEDNPNAQAVITQTGDSVDLATNVEQAGHISGRLQKLDVTINPAYIQLVEALRFLLEESAPDTGQAEISASTQPWTARLSQAQSNVKPKDLLQQQQRAIRACMRSIARDMATPVEEGGIGDVVWVFKRDDSGEVTGETVGVQTMEIPTLNIAVDIDATSAAERITLTEHGVNLKERGHITRLTLNSDYLRLQNPVEYGYDLDVERIMEEQVKPGLIRQLVAAEVGSMYTVGPNGEITNGAGQTMPPGAVAEASGWKRAQQSQMPPLVDNAPPQVGVRQPSIPAVGQ
jgi:hypothetical protein